MKLTITVKNYETQTGIPELACTDFNLLESKNLIPIWCIENGNGEYVVNYCNIDDIRRIK